MNTVEGILADLAANRIAPVYFLQGEEVYFIDRISTYIESNLLAEASKSFNLIVLYGRDISMADLLSNARRFPMMSDRQVVVVREAQNMTDLGKEAGQKMLEQYLRQPQPSTILVICYKYKTFDRRRSFTKTLEKHTVFFDARKLYDNQLPAWIADYVQTRGYRISDKAVQMLTDYIGNNLERLCHEIDKTLLNIAESVEITDDIIQRYVGISKEYNAFELQKAIAEGNRAKAFTIAAYFDANPKNNPIIPVIALLFSFFNRILLLHHHGAYSEQKAAVLLKINPFFAREYINALRIYPPELVLRCIRHLHCADLQSKGVNAAIPDGEILRELIFKLMPASDPVAR